MRTIRPLRGLCNPSQESRALSLPERFPCRTLAAAIALALAGLSAAWAQPAAEQERLLYHRVLPGESLIAISRRLLENPADWRLVATENGLTPKRTLQPGQVLAIPRELLKSVPGEAVVEILSGGARISQQPLQLGQKVSEAAVIETEADGVVQLRLSDGSTLRIAPSSRLRLERLRRYHRDDVVESRSVLEQGRIEAKAAPARTKPLQIRTPYATAAVRGTDFRVSAQSEAATSEVLTGAVRWGNVEAVAVGAGFGAAGTAQGVTPPEPLLPAPDLAQLAAISTNASLRAEFAPVAGARAYRVAVSNDEKFQSVLRESVSTSSVLEFDTRTDGAHYFRVRPVSASRVEGFDTIARVDVKARPFAPRTQAPANNGITFVPKVEARWSAAADASGYRVQLAADPQFAQILSEQTVNDTAAALTIEPDPQRRTVRLWRVAGINATGGYLGPYSAPTELRFYATPEPPNVIRDYAGDTLVGWRRFDGERYVLQLARNNEFTQPQSFATDAAQQALNSLPAGRYYLRLAATSTDGVTTPYSGSAELRVKDRVRSGTGLMLESGTGVPIESPSY